MIKEQSEKLLEVEEASEMIFGRKSSDSDTDYFKRWIQAAKERVQMMFLKVLCLMYLTALFSHSDNGSLLYSICRYEICHS